MLIQLKNKLLWLQNQLWTCLEDGRSAQYDGDPGRNAYTRGLEHLDALKLKNEESPLWKHCVPEHQEKMQIFQWGHSGHLPVA